MKTYDQMVRLFECANEQFLETDYDLITSNVNERTLCGALMLHLWDQIKDDPMFNDYFTDIEYNRNRGAIKTVTKTTRGAAQEIIRINCDLILHSRGRHPEQDNLIAVEMKKSTRPFQEKESDRNRLKALTSDSFDGVWSFDGHTLPEHVCRYVLGVYYEIDPRRRNISIEYYHRSEKKKEYSRLLSQEKGCRSK